MRPRTFLEALASARSQPVASAITILMISGMILAVLLTTGKTVGAEQSVVSSIDSAGTRSITVRAENDAGVTTDVLDRLATLEGIEWAGAFSSATDGSNAGTPGGARVPIRSLYTQDLQRVGIPPTPPVPGDLVYVSDMALQELGMQQAAGAVDLPGMGTVGVAGTFDIPDFLSSMEPAAFIPRAHSGKTETVNLLVVIATRPELVAPVQDAVLSVLSPSDPSKVTVSSSEQLAALRELVQSQLSSFSRGLVLALLGLTGLLVAVVLYGLVILRRKDFGRRRALGATRGFIVRLLLWQTLTLATLGVLVGSALGTALLVMSADPLPGATFYAALAVLTLATAGLASLAPAIAASRRDPLRELRVP